MLISYYEFQVKELAANKYEDSELSRMLDRLNLQESTPSMPAYDDLYPPHWANNEELERRHLALMLKIKKWPMNDNEVRTRSRETIQLTICLSVRLQPCADDDADPVLRHARKLSGQVRECRQDSAQVQPASSTLPQVR